MSRIQHPHFGLERLDLGLGSMRFGVEAAAEVLLRVSERLPEVACHVSRLVINRREDGHPASAQHPRGSGGP